MINKTEDIENEKFTFLAPTRETLKIVGRLFYSEGNQAWTFMRLKKEILQEFPQLKEKRSNFSYVIILPRSYGDMKKITIKMEKKHEIVPMLMFFARRKSEVK